jgi:hypothetical protein
MVEMTAENGEVFSGSLRDISIESLYVASDSSRLKSLRLDDTVDIDISVEQISSRMTICSSAHVARYDGGGIALRFLSPLKWWPVFCLFQANEEFLPG